MALQLQRLFITAIAVQHFAAEVQGICRHIIDPSGLTHFRNRCVENRRRVMNITPRRSEVGMLSTIGIRAGSRVTMARLEQIEGLMEQLGPVLDPLNVTAFPSEKAWGVQVDEDTAVLVDFDEEQGKLVLSCEIGAPPAGDRSKLYELLLRHNFHWDETGGSR